MPQRVIVRLNSPGSVAFSRPRDGRKVDDRDGRGAERPDGPAHTSSPRPVIRGESPPDDLLARIDGRRAHEVPWLT